MSDAAYVVRDAASMAVFLGWMRSDGTLTVDHKGQQFENGAGEWTGDDARAWCFETAEAARDAADILGFCVVIRRVANTIGNETIL